MAVLANPNRWSAVRRVVGRENARVRAAVSSMARGRRSTLVQIVATADIDGVVEHELTIGVRGPAGEKLHRIVELERLQCSHTLARDTERLSTRSQHGNARARTNDCRGDLGRFREHVLAVVEHDQQLGRGESRS